jgi:hypothetical protein
VLLRAEVVTGRQGRAHLAAVTAFRSVSGGAALVRVAGESLCAWPALLWPTPGAVVTCAACRAAAALHRVVIVARPSPARFAFTAVRPVTGRATRTHWRCDAEVNTPLFRRSPGQLACHARSDLRIAQWPLADGPVTCVRCIERVARLGWSPPGRCLVTGCPVRFASGGNRRCAAHAEPVERNPWRALRARIAADVAAAAGAR